MTKRQFKAQVRSCVKESMKVLDSKMDKLLKSGAVNLKDADLSTCKAAVTAFFLEEAGQFSPREEQMRVFCKEVINMRQMM